jgi:hypothetical protein
MRFCPRRNNNGAVQKKRALAEADAPASQPWHTTANVAMMDFPARSVAAAGVTCNIQTTTSTWSNASENYDAAVEANSRMTGAQHSSAIAATIGMTATHVSDAGDIAGACWA